MTRGDYDWCVMQPGRRTHLAAALAALATAAGVVWVINAPPSADESAVPAEAPRAALLAIEPEVLDMGDLVPRQPVTRTVTVRNLVDRPVRVTSAVASCGCTTSTWPIDPIPPGGTAEAQVTIEAGDSQGERLVKQVNYLPEGGAPALLTVSGLVGSFVSCEPRIVDEPAPGTGDPACEIVVESLDGTAFRVDAVDPPVAALPSPDMPSTRQALRIEWSRWRDQGRPAHLTIEVDHPKAPKLGVVVRRAIQK